ncbi:MAG: DUF4230 domain-containing protein [Planctomycetes bacterium]|nr:DUF4230 domain-containing protein [Planctomycetota bacterium]NOG55995.1 DUF4230 domain-containing protein [Planctomycetota bacterium]
MFETLITILVTLVVGAVVGIFVMRRWFRDGHAPTTTVSHTIAERVRSVGRLVGLEVMSKEIVTQTKGLSWMPPLLLSQARLAMIFHFEKQYFVDLARVKSTDIRHLGGNRYQLTLPPIDGRLTLHEVTPYDIQSGKLLGLVDILPMDAKSQKHLMEQAQQEAASLYEKNAERYLNEARCAVSKQVSALLEMFGVDVEIRYDGESLRLDGQLDGDRLGGGRSASDGHPSSPHPAQSDEPVVMARKAGRSLLQWSSKQVRSAAAG